jgi:hypothetical protein
MLGGEKEGDLAERIGRVSMLGRESDPMEGKIFNVKEREFQC